MEGDAYAKLRERLAKEIELRKTSKRVLGKVPSESKLAGIGGANKAELERTIAEVESSSGVPVLTREDLEQYLRGKYELDQLRRTKTPEAEKAAEFAYDTAQAQRLVEGNFPSRKINLGKREELQSLATEMGDENLLSKVRDAGYQQELGKGALAGSRMVNIGRSIGRAVAGGAGEAVGGIAGAVADVSAGQLTTKPLDAYRLLEKTANTKWGKTLQEAYRRGGPNGAKNVAVTHYLLQQKDPEYNKATTENEE
jgi:hypothetical protein